MTSPSPSAPRKPLDPITFAVLKSAFESIVDDMAYTVMRTARSPIVRDVLDYSATIYDHGIEVHFVQRLRPVQRFPDAAALKNAISHDVASARIILENLNATYLKLKGGSESCAH